ncbi:J domain-containing protein [Hyphobacterium sp.]|uniref:J domain-containing protein n=1 Tax=Hyphobacterium sp. TaxID=2004662 RepID=UPI003BAA9F60
MDGEFTYKPRFKDIRIKPPTDKAAPEERVCEWPGCRAHGDCKAPKGTADLNDVHWFCKSHAAQYNKSWNFFEDMDEEAVAAFNASAQHGHRPTWNFRGNTGRQSRAQKASKDFREGFADPFGLFGKRPDGDPNPEPRRRQFGKLQAAALETLQLDGTESKGQVKKRYAEMVKRFHPDANGGDRSSEEQLGRVIHAYQILKNAGMA